MDKPGRRKKQSLPWKKLTAVAVVALLVLGAGWEIYWTYIYKAPPVYARVDTSYGSFEVELFPACAPQTVANFVSLANHGFYNNLVWHRIVPGFVIQTGDPRSRGGLNSSRATWGTGSSNTTIPFEWCGWLHNYSGYLAMASTSPRTGGTSQFFINLSNSSSNLNLDGNYSVFGKVVSGMSVVYKIGKAPLCLPPTCPKNWPADEPLPAVFVDDVVILGPTTQAASSS